ncbi:hypothetical protein N8T08_004978 [Aspergillus melleus]|uniref:Uncharacterized protein n=1 Tax=Aspergillus melleus TaxID=138277 RepID=A0ACC3B316_9EURO|nr:hypothetical protein N8T08_004978 [Aspergillus melleus]
MNTHPEPSQTKRRESRAGTRKVTSLSAEQLERKRANDREAQRTIRQRTREHIERLEHQVSELKTKGEQFDDIVRRNAALENEIRTLKQQLTIAPSVLSTSSQVSVTHEWQQQYGSTRSPSICESSDADYSNRVEPYIFDGQPRNANTMPVRASHVTYNAHGSGQPPGPAFQTYPSHLYAPGGPNQPHPEEMAHHPQHPIPFAGGQRSVLVPNVSAEREAGGYPVLQSTPQYQQPEQPPRPGYSYEWMPRS